MIEHFPLIAAELRRDGWTREQIEAVIADGPVLSARQQPTRPEYHIVTVPTLTLDDIQPQGPNPSMREIIERSSKNGLSARERGKLGGRPRSAERCPCGAMSKTRAEQRRHYCSAA